MSDLLWPVLPGQRRMDAGDDDEFDTTIARTVNGLEQRTIWLTAPDTRIRLSVLARSNVAAPAPWQAYSELALVRKWFADHYGSGDSFLFDDNGTQLRVRFASDRLGGTWITPQWKRFEIELVTV